MNEPKHIKPAFKAGSIVAAVFIGYMGLMLQIINFMDRGKGR